MKLKNAQIITLSAQLFELSGTVPTEIKLLPAGLFKAKDGRPNHLEGWLLNDALASQLISAANAQTDNYLIDYDHQTLYSKDNGQQAPAAGWFSKLEWRPDDGLYALEVEWTDKAKAAIEAKEYRYISPVIKSDPITGQVTSLLMAALVNYPAIDGLTDLTAAQFNPESPLLQDKSKMNEKLAKLLGLDAGADDAAIIAAVKALKKSADSATTACSALTEQLNAPADPAKYVPVEAMQAMQSELSALSATVKTDNINKLIAPALADGRLLPAQKAWAESLGQSNIDALSAFLATAQPIAALQHTQTQGVAPAGDDINALSSDELKVAEQLGISHEDMIKNRGAK